MIGVITGDIINSEKFAQPDEWLTQLKALFGTIGPEPGTWEIMRGDSFQVQIAQAETVLATALYIKATIKRNAGLDARMAIGIGTKSYDAPKVSEANGEAFIHSGRLFDQLKKNTLAVKSPWQAFDSTINLCLELASLTMDKWTANSAEIMALSLENPGKTQAELANMLGISQGRVSERQQRAGYDAIMKLETFFRESVQQQLNK